jgi:predicted MFS family arabinose efflux permease|tara:strand:- start:1242 stop:2483 length:1242 start_codon:yes stop_codon:yes gene_type:complete
MTESTRVSKSIWRDSKFLAYMGSITFYSAGFSMQQLIISWLLVGVLVLPGDEVGLVQAAIGIPGLFLMLWGGASADNRDPRSILINVYLITWLFPLMLVICIHYDLLNIWTILLFGLAVSTATSFSSPAQQAILTQVAGGEIQKAVTASTALMFLVQIFSLGFAGQMDNVGLSAVLTVQAGCILLGALTIMRLNKTAPLPRPADETSWKRLTNGFKATYNNKRVYHLLLINFISSVFNAGAFMTVVPFVVKRAYEGDALQLATIMIIFYLGATLTNLFMLRVMPIARPGRWFLLMQLSRVVILALLWIKPDWWLLIIAMFAWGLNMGVTTTLSRTIVQESAEPEFRARILSVYSLGLIGSAPIGAIVLGNIIEIFGTLEALIPAMFVSVILFIYGVFFSPVWNYVSPTPTIDR